MLGLCVYSLRRPKERNQSWAAVPGQLGVSPGSRGDAGEHNRALVSAHQGAKCLEVPAHAVTSQVAITRLDGGSDPLVGTQNLGGDLVAGLGGEALDLMKAAEPDQNLSYQ